MKILYIAHTTDWHGSSIALFNLVKAFSNRHDIHVLLPKKGGELYDNLKKLNVVIHSFEFRMNIVNENKNKYKVLRQMFGTFYVNAKAKRKFEKLIKDISPDIVHCNVGPVSFSSDVCAKRRIPHVWHIREYQDKDFGLKFIPSRQAFINKVSDPNNTAIAITKDIFSYWHLNPSKDRVIYDGVFSKDIKLPVPDRKKRFLFVGRVDPSKGTLEVIEAFHEFSKQNPEYELLIAGAFSPDRNTYARECQDYVMTNSLENRISFLKERTDIYDLMASSQALIVASRSEGFGFITVEAMLNKTIVIGKNSGGTKEQFDNGMEWSGKEIGFRYDTIEDLIKVMNSIPSFSDDNLIERAYDVVWNKYSVQTHSDQIEKVYLDLLNK